ncbi:MAG: biopolymer transporter ExbD [Saprospiraceae bacterium]|nr:biopolymer transporter ExbD [Saprospiraceae bacterium]
MADISNAPAHNKGHGGKPAVKRMSTRIDFTPMVDLGFLLITFFMLTTALSKPHIMALVMPDRSDPAQVDYLKSSKALTLLLGNSDKIYWYEGIENVRLDSTVYGSEGLRSIILKKMELVRSLWGMESYRDPKTGQPKQGSFLYVLIKPTRDARYKNLVDALDEMAICGVRYYTILDISEQETAFIKNPVAGMNLKEAMQKNAIGKNEKPI